jgi:tetratricopeptide (TPR) repeat protein
MPSPIESEVLRARALLQAGNFAAALEAARALRQQVPENRDVLYLIAVSQRYLNQPEAALATLAELEALHPTYSRLHQERGHAQLAARRPAEALAAFLQAVHLNPALPASWNALNVLYRAAGRPEDAEMAAGHVAKLKTLAPAVIAGSGLFADGEVHEAERIVRAHLQTSPRDVEAMRLLARIAIELDIIDDADFLLESVLAFAPDYHLARYEYVRVLLQRHRHAKALDEARILLEAEPDNRNYRAIYASACLSLDRYDEAIAVYRELLQEAPMAADIHLSIGHGLKTLGRQPEAIEAYRAAAAVNPSFGDAYWSLANLKTYRFEPAELDRMRRAEAEPATTLTDRFHLCFALGKALEDNGDYAESFEYYQRGNALKKQQVNYRPDIIERNAAQQKHVCTAEFFAARRNAGCPARDPIFIVGLPRAGSTLLEQILASHSLVEGTMELADIPRLVVRLQGRTLDNTPLYPANLAQLSPEQFRRFGEKYLSDTQIYRTGKPFFIDKNPNNFRHLGLIHLILPNARVIDARRDAMACCFSNYKQLFAAGQEFTYDLVDIARYYRSYVDLMAHWDAALPGKILRVQHEDVVDDLETSVRRILDFCGLPFEPQCLNFHQTERSVRTASSEQVRRPIYRDGVDQWRRFAPFLAPLAEALEDDSRDHASRIITLSGA